MKRETIKITLNSGKRNINLALSTDYRGLFDSILTQYIQNKISFIYMAPPHKNKKNKKNQFKFTKYQGIFAVKIPIKCIKFFSHNI